MFDFPNGKLPEVIAWPMIHHMLAPVVFLHTQSKPGVTHQNITPENIPVALPQLGPGFWPDFYLGDLGMSQMLGSDANEMKASELVAVDLESIIRSISKVVTRDFEDSGVKQDLEAAIQSVRCDKTYGAGLSNVSKNSLTSHS